MKDIVHNFCEAEITNNVNKKISSIFLFKIINDDKSMTSKDCILLPICWRLNPFIGCQQIWRQNKSLSPKNLKSNVQITFVKKTSLIIIFKLYSLFCFSWSDIGNTWILL